jgi:phenol hydroxylase P5 protein
VRDFDGTVTRIESLTPTIKGIWIQLDAPIHFQAGQYVNLEIPTLGFSRPFSLAQAPGEQPIELNVRIVAGGAGTAYLHEQLKAGDPVRLSGPYGRFFVRKSAAQPLIFMGSTEPITLVYGQRNRAELYYHEEFTALAAKHPHLTYVAALSHEPQDSDWSGFRGFVHEAAKAHFNDDFRDHKAYLCGPPLMIEACISTLMQGRLFERDIYMEKFLSAADAQQVRSPLFKKL